MAWHIIGKTNIVIDDEYNLQKDIDYVFNSSHEKEIVLCVGKVQSGKTNKMFKCMERAMFFDGYDITIILSGTTNYLFNQTKYRLIKECNKNNYSFDLLIKDEVKYKKYVDGKKYVLVILKNNTGLDAADTFLYSIDDLSKKKILILDDESDFASVNIDKNELSATYKRIHRLYDFIYRGKLLQITATPFANIISTNSSELRPNRVICWSNPLEYTGLLEFNEYSNKVYEIVECDKDNLPSCKKVVEKTINYFISTIINNFDFFNNKDELSCLFNIDLSTETHNVIVEYVKIALRKIADNRNLFYKNYIDTNITYETYEKKYLYSIFENIEIIELNSKTDQNNKKKFNIFIGGTLVSRGNTFENLITELIVNNPKVGKISVDTLLQRCRWFGYRNEIMKYMKIFMSDSIYQSLIESINYVDLLTIGEHEPIELNRSIKILDGKSIYVRSTGKE